VAGRLAACGTRVPQPVNKQTSGRVFTGVNERLVSRICGDIF
jgi:hypothetical protein